MLGQVQSRSKCGKTEDLLGLVNLRVANPAWPVESVTYSLYNNNSMQAFATHYPFLKYILDNTNTLKVEVALTKTENWSNVLKSSKTDPPAYSIQIVWSMISQLS